MQRKRAGCTALLAVALAALGLAGSASATLTGNYTRFQQCPFSNLEVKKCLFSVTESGEVVLGSKKVPIVNPVTLQGGYGAAVEGFAPFFAATNGETLSKSPQPVPGGLLGLVPPEGSPPLIKALVEAAAKNGLTGVNSTLELAKPASEIRISEKHLGEEEDVAIKIPVKIHLENPFLGSNCYVGSPGTPIIWELTSGETAPPPPNEPIVGSAGSISFLEEGRILFAEEAELVDNAWSAPGATGCGGPLLELLVDPVIDIAGELPAESGHNTAILVSDASLGSALAVRKNNEENP
jgi:hypothetical protein